MRGLFNLVLLMVFIVITCSVSAYAAPENLICSADGFGDHLVTIDNSQQTVKIPDYSSIHGYEVIVKHYDDNRIEFQIIKVSSNYIFWDGVINRITGRFYLSFEDHNHPQSFIPRSTGGCAKATQKF